MEWTLPCIFSIFGRYGFEFINSHIYLSLLTDWNMFEQYEQGEYKHGDSQSQTDANDGGRSLGENEDDVFGHEENHEVVELESLR